MHIYFHIARGYFRVWLQSYKSVMNANYVTQSLSYLLGSPLPKRLPVAEEMAQLRISRGPKSNY